MNEGKVLAFRLFRKLASTIPDTSIFRYDLDNEIHSNGLKTKRDIPYSTSELLKRCNAIHAI